MAMSRDCWSVPSKHPQPRIHNCRHSEDVGLRCLKPGQAPPWVVDIEFGDPPGGNGAYDVGETLDVTLVWSEPVTVSITVGRPPPEGVDRLWLSSGTRCICQGLRHGPHGVQSHGASWLALPGESPFQHAAGAGRQHRQRGRAA